jgi:hypothetical protein
MSQKIMEERENDMMKKKKTNKPKPGTREYIESLCGILGYKGNASEELLKERREDDIKFMRKMARFEKLSKNTEEKRE